MNYWNGGEADTAVYTVINCVCTVLYCMWRNSVMCVCGGVYA